MDKNREMSLSILDGSIIFSNAEKINGKNVKDDLKRNPLHTIYFSEFAYRLVCGLVIYTFS
jgi:hypothetical protein